MVAPSPRARVGGSAGGGWSLSGWVCIVGGGPSLRRQSGAYAKATRMSGPRARRPPRQAPSPPVWPGRPVSPTLCHAGHYVGHGDGRPRTVPKPARSEGRRSGALRKRGKRPHPKAYHYALEPTTYDRERAPASTPTRVVHHPATARTSGGTGEGLLGEGVSLGERENGTSGLLQVRDWPPTHYRRHAARKKHAPTSTAQATADGLRGGGGDTRTRPNE